MKKKNRKRMIFGIAGILFMAGVVIGIIGVLGKGEKEQKQTRTKTDTIEAASELEQEKGMPTGSDDEKVKTETTPKGTEEEVTAVTESPEKTETEDIAEPFKVYPLSRTFLSNRQTVTVTFPADNFLFPIGCMK